MFFANQSCDAFTPQKKLCKLGNYPVYVINVSTVAHVSAALKFANTSNIRIVIRNTGHEYVPNFTTHKSHYSRNSFLGRSTGAGALAIWTHHLKRTEVIPNYSSPSYNGPAFYIESGVQGADVIEAAQEHGLVVLGGSCPSVGLAGGYTQGGGHSILSTSFGLAADQVLEYNVVTADGKLVKASPEENADLYWALSGGGGGTFAVVFSITVRAHPSGMIGGGKIVVPAIAASTEAYEKIVEKVHEVLPQMVDQGATVNYLLNRQFFSIGPFTVFNSTKEYVRDIVAAPIIKLLKEMGIPSKAEFTTLSYRDHFDKFLGPLPMGTLRSSEWQYGGRLVPRSSIENNHIAFSAALNNLTSHVGMLVGTAGNFNPRHEVNNSVNPAWCSTILELQVLTPWIAKPEAWPAMVRSQQQMSDEFLPQIKAASPGGAAYMNEADPRELNWREEWYGENWDKLNEVKKKWDPNDLFYVFKGVGSDAWNVDEHGRMCRA